MNNSKCVYTLTLGFVEFMLVCFEASRKMKQFQETINLYYGFNLELLPDNFEAQRSQLKLPDSTQLKLPDSTSDSTQVT